MKASDKSKLVRFALAGTPVSVFNDAVNLFSTGRIIYHMKRRLMLEFPDLLPDDLRFGIVMADIFREFQVDEINLPTELYQIDRLKSRYTTLRRMRIPRYVELQREYNERVMEYNAKLTPQNKMIRLYKRLRKKATSQ